MKRALLLSASTVVALCLGAAFAAAQSPNNPNMVKSPGVMPGPTIAPGNIGPTGIQVLPRSVPVPQSSESADTETKKKKKKKKDQSARKTPAGSGEASKGAPSGAGTAGILSLPEAQPGAAQVALPDTAALPPDFMARLRDRFGDRVAADMIKQLQEHGSVGVGFPEPKPGRPSDTPPFGITKHPGTHIGDPYFGSGPTAAGGKVRDPRGLASDYSEYSGGAYTDSRGRVHRVEVETRRTDDDRMVAQRTIDSVRTGRNSSSEVEIRLRPRGGIYYERHTERRDGRTHTVIVERLDREPGPEVIMDNEVIPYDEPVEGGPPKDPDTAQPAPTDDYRSAAIDDCLWRPGPCTKRTDPMEMTGQPGRGEGGGPGAGGLPNVSHVINPDGRDGPVGLRTAPDPDATKPIDPAPLPGR